MAAAREFLQRLVPRLQAVEKLALRSALGRVLAEDIVSPIDVPAQDNSAMDGYAFRAADLAVAGETVLEVVGSGFAGGGVAAAVGPGQCVRIMTGATMPAGPGHGRAAGVRARRRRAHRPRRRRRAPGREPAPRRRRPGARRDRARRRPAAAPGRHRRAGVARPRRGAGVSPPARRLLLDRRRAALDRRAAHPGLGLRQQPLHALGDAAAPRRRRARPGRRPRRSRRPSRPPSAPPPTPPTR